MHEHLEIILIVLGGLISGLILMPKKPKKPDTFNKRKPFSLSIRLSGEKIRCFNHIIQKGDKKKWVSLNM